jgi:hypothetical protein
MLDLHSGPNTRRASSMLQFGTHASGRCPLNLLAEKWAKNSLHGTARSAIRSFLFSNLCAIDSAGVFAATPRYREGS